MIYLKCEISISNVEKIVEQLSNEWKGNEEWLTGFALKLNDRNKRLRDALRDNKNTWTHDQYKACLAYHYYEISGVFNELYIKHELDAQSIVLWLERCLELLAEIPAKNETTNSAKLRADAEEYCEKSKKLVEALNSKRRKLESKKGIEYIALSIALGDISDNAILLAKLRACEETESPLWTRKLQNLIIFRVIVYLEDSFTNRNHKNPLVTSNLLLSLGRAYNIVGISFLGERYQNTSQELLRSVLQSNSTEKEIQQNIKKIITVCVKDGTSLEQVYHLIEGTYSQPISVIDQAYICRRYVKSSFKQYIEDTVEFLASLAEDNKDRRMIHDILDNLKSSDSLLHIAHPLDQSVPYRLLKSNYHLIDKKSEHKWMTILKKDCFMAMIDYVNASRKELHFFEVFVDFLGSTKDTKYLENKLNIHVLCSQDVPLVELVRAVLDLDVAELGEELKRVQLAAAPLKDECNLYYEDKFRNFIIDYFKPPNIQKVNVDGRNVLEITGLKIVLSEITYEPIFREILEGGSFEEIRIVGGKSVHVDVSFDDPKWHGKNIVVLTNCIRVHGEVIWDISGTHSTLVYSSSAGKDTDGRGKQGEDGEAGESGGNVLVLVEKFVNSKNLKIISLGGNGSDGQDGGDGSDGSDGKSITKSEFESKFPPVAKYQLGPRLKNTITTLESIRGTGDVTFKWYERPVSDVSKWVPFASLYKNVIMEDSYCFDKSLQNIIDDLTYNLNYPLEDHNRFNGNIYVLAKTNQGNELEFCFQRSRDTVNCQAYFLFKGTPGMAGCKGGEPGFGGQGGFGGDIVVRDPHNPTGTFDIVNKSHSGSDGKIGRGGKVGSHGKDGGDMGYLDYFVTNFFSSSWPKWYGGDGGSKVELTYHDSATSERVWSPYRRYENKTCKYVGMSSTGLDHHKSRQFEERATVSQSRERASHAKATKKKTISQASVLLQYQHLLESKTSSFATLFTQLDKTNDELLQLIAHTTTSKFDVETKAEFKRCAAYRKVKSRVVEDCPLPSPQPITGIKARLIHELNTQPMPLVAWKALKTMHLNKDELLPLFHIFNSLHASTEESEILGIRKMFLEKYRFATLHSIAKVLLENDPDFTVKDIDAINARKYLAIDLEDAFMVSHPELGSIAQFFSTNKDQERKKLVHYINYSMNNFNNGFLDIFRSFVIALGDYCSSSDDLKTCFADYNKYIERKNQGFIVFPESFEIIDRKHSKNGKIVKDIKKYIINEGCLTPPCIELLARVFNVNIRVYGQSSSPFEPFYLKDDVNPQKRKNFDHRAHIFHVVIHSGKCSPLQVDWNAVKLEKKRKTLGTQFSNILQEVKGLDSAQSLDTYLESREFLDKNYFTDDYLDDLNKVDKAIILKKILDLFDDLEDQAVLGTRLSKVSKYVPGEIIESIHRKFSFEGRSVNVGELCCLINAVLASAAEGDSLIGLYQWIVFAYPQHQWIDQVILLELETFLGKPLTPQFKRLWEEYLSKVKNKSILLHLREKLLTSKRDPDIEKCLGDILRILSETDGDFNLGELGLAEWPCALKEKYWSQKLTAIRKWDDPMELSTHSYYLISIGNVYGDQLVERLTELLTALKTQVTQDILTTISCSFYNAIWDLSTVELDMLESSKDVDKWVQSMKKMFLCDGGERSLKRLCELVVSNANTTDSIKALVPTVKDKLVSVTVTKKALRDYNESDISSWVKAFSKALTEADNDITQVKLSLDDILVEMLEVVDSAIFARRGFRLRDTQKLAVMILLKNKKSTLAQVSTGEGKSLIVVAVSIIEGLVGQKVDIITSSSVLAKRDAEINQDIYSLFGINVSHNCNEDIEVRKEAYSGNQIVYGDLSDFQRDYLLHEFYNINVLGDRKFERVVVDEVDSMLLDKGNNMLYLSHNIPGLDKLESLYLFIWQHIGSPCADRDNILLSMDFNNIRNAVIFDMYGTIRIEDIKALDVKMSIQVATAIWENMKKNDIIDESSRLKIDTLNKADVECVVSTGFSQYIEPLCYLINECLFRDRQIHVPNYLKPFVDLHLDKWIQNATQAFFMRNGEDYVVDVDRTGTSPDRNPNITIIDKDTGTDQSNSQWDEALHQFLQLKHGCKVSTQSLKAVFISNVSYFKQYKHLYGLTGTLGSQGERKLLTEVHNVDFVTIPTAKPKQFHELAPKVCSNIVEWKNVIKTAALNVIQRDNRSVLIICQTVNDVEELHQAFGGKSASYIHTYARDYEEFDITQSKQELTPGHIIIATNLAGRGTDIKIDNQLKKAGGLHVIVAYLPKNTRIEQQAFGRAARCGEKGSGQLIIPITDRKDSKILNLKNKRDNDELERISEIKRFYENQIKIEEMCFGKFREQFIALKNIIKKTNANVSLSESLATVVSAGNKVLDDGVQSAVEEVIEGVASAGRTLMNETKSALRIDTSKVPKEVEDLVLKTCINRWAFWLDRNNKHIKDSANMASRNSLNSSLDQFLSEMKNLNVEGLEGSQWLSEDPVLMMELAKYFLRNKNYDYAISLLDKVIGSEADFAEGAHYYKAAALGSKIDWESQPSEDDCNVKTMKAELLLAAKQFDQLGSNAMTKAAMIGKMKHKNLGLVQVDAYEEQQKNISNLCRFFSMSIHDALGHTVTPETFSSWNIKDANTNTLYHLLIEKKILTKPKIVVSNMAEMDLETIACEYDISISLLKDFLRDYDGKEITSFKQFKNDLKTRIRLPSKELFWKELVSKEVLKCEVKYVIVKVDNLAEVDPSLLEKLATSCACKTELDLTPGANQILLNPEQLEEQVKNTLIFQKEDFIVFVGKKKYMDLKEKEVLGFNRRCDIDIEKLKSVAVVHPKTLRAVELTGLIGEAEGASLIDLLCQGNIIKRMDAPDQFQVVGNIGNINGLAVADEVKNLLKKFSGNDSLQLKYYDSITTSDLTRNKVCKDDAKSILNELELNGMIEKIPETSNYRLTAHYTKIDGLQLETPVYQTVVASVMKSSFAYRIALQILASCVERNLAAKLFLKTKPHMDFFWSLYDFVIEPSKVEVGVLKEDIQKATTALDNDVLHNLVAKNVFLPREKVDDFIENLVAKQWLVVTSPSEYQVERDKSKRKSLGCYAHCQKTITKLFDQLMILSDESTISSLEQSLKRLESKLKALEVPCFVLKPLTEALGEGDFSMVQELRGFLLNGLSELIVLEEKAYTFKFWRNVTCVVLLGIFQIIVGAIIDLYSVGAFTYVGNAFISEGISDIMFAIGAMRTGYFSWKDYGRHKVESVALTIVTAGVGAYWSKGTKFSRVGQKLNPTGLAAKGTKVTQVAGAELLKKANQSVAKEVAKTVIKKTIEAVAFGTVNSMIDATINNHLQSLCAGIASDILAEIDEEVSAHPIASSLEKAFRIKGESEARAMVQQLTDDYFTRKSEFENMVSWAMKINSSILAGFAQAAAKKQSAGVTTTKFDAVIQLTTKSMVWLSRASDILEIRSMARQMLDELAEDIDSKLENCQPTSSEFDETKYAQFKAEIVNGWREEIKKRGGDIIGKQIISPLMKDGAHFLLRAAGRKVKEYYRQFKDNRYYQELLSRRNQYRNDIEMAGDDEAAKERITKEYHRSLIKLAAATRNPSLYADIIREDIPLDIMTLHVVAPVLQEILSSRGNQDGIKVVIEKDDMSQEFEVPGASGETNIVRLRITDNHFDLLDDNGQVVPMPPEDGQQRSNNCLIRAIAQRVDLGMSDGEFRHLLADRVETHPNVRHFIEQGYQRYGILLGLHGGRAHPYERPGHWEYDPKKDIDLVSYQKKNGEKIVDIDEMSNKQLNERLKSGYNEVLKKINDIVTGKSDIEGWENVKLLKSSRIRPEDFEATMFDTVYTTASFGKVDMAYYPVEMETIIAVKHGQNVVHFTIEINIDVPTDDKKGPQGPHIGYTIKQYTPPGEDKIPRGLGPKKVVGHCLISTTGNDRVPRRALMSDKDPGVVYVPGRKYKEVPDYQRPEDIPRLPLSRLFYGSARVGSRLQRVGDGTGSTRNRSFPSPNF